MVGNPPAITVIFGALALFAWVGFRTRTRTDDVEDYMVARKSQGAARLGLSFLASGMGAWILFAPPEVGAFVGLVAVAGYAIGAAAPLIAVALIGRRLKRMVPAGHALTEFVRLRFGRGFHAYVVGISILYMVVFLIAELTAVGGVTAILTGVDGRVTVVAVALVTLAYTAYGGLRASLRTDSLQAWMIVALLATGAVAIFVDTRAPAEAVRASGLMGVERVGLEVALTLVIAVVAANMFHQGYWQRMWAATDQRALDRGALLGSAVVIPVVLLVGVMGVLASGRELDLGSPPVPFFALLVGLPAWVGALVLALGVSLVASSVDTLENALASLIVIERPAMSLPAARAVTVVLMVPAILVAVQGYSVLRLFLIADLLCAATVIPTLMGLWARATAGGAFAGAVAGLAGAVAPGLLSTGSPWEGVRLATFPDAVPTLAPFLWAVIASAVVAAAVSLAAGKTADLDSIDARVPALGPHKPRGATFPHL